MDRQPPPCGTPEGYRWHYRLGEERDQACKDAMAAYGRRQRAGEVSPRALAACGSLSAAKRHREMGESLDDACREAEARRERQRWATDARYRERNRVKARDRARRKAGRPTRRTCPVCGLRFTPQHGGRTYCDEVCAELAVELRKGGSRLLELRMAAPEARAAIVARIAARRQTPKAERKRERYGRKHQLARQAAVAELDPLAPCPRCLEPLGVDAAMLDLDHDDDDPTRYLGLSHATCNRSRRPVLRLPVEAVA